MYIIKSRKENDLLQMFQENKELISRKWLITGPRSITGPLMLWSNFFSLASWFALVVAIGVKCEEKTFLAQNIRCWHN